MRRPKAYPFRRGDTYWARVRYVDESGKTREEVARAESAADARAKSTELVKKYDEGGDSQPKPITFNKFAELFLPHIESQRSYKPSLSFLHTLQDHFGGKQLTSITHGDIQAYAKKRRNTKSLRTGKKFKAASVNREVALLSRMFNEAIEQGFLTANPCKDGPRLINPKEETKRDRILTTEEEERLLAACTGRRVHLRPVILAALGTGATKSQLLRYTWGDIHLGLQQIKSPGNKPGWMRMNQELVSALVKLQDELLKEYTGDSSLSRGKDAPLFEEWKKPMRVFRDFKSAFPSACRAAEIKDLRFHDLRRTYVTRYQEKVKRVRAAFDAAAKKIDSEKPS